ncbi:MAG: transcription elongation factor GreA, partial [Alistipes sp.]|nr:transcription elongation factor GreA [Alistipes sp.]
MAKEIIYLTAEGYKKLKDELDHMRSVERPAASAAIAEARDKGDLSENAEYDAAREA